MRTSKPDFYRLIYFSPRPEDGEQLCVAVLVWTQGRWILVFDEKMTKLRSIATEKDVQFVRSVIESLRFDLDGKELDAFLAAIEPQFRASEPRRLLVPWSEDLNWELHRRFLSRERVPSVLFEREHEKQLQDKIRGLVSSVVPGLEENFVAGVKPSDLFGESFSRQFRGAKPIARAIVGRTRAVLIDGVDTSVKPSTLVIQKANRIAFTFWQYWKATQGHDLPPRAPKTIFRAGVVFDGYPRTELVTAYSLHQFQKDADLAFEIGDSAAAQRIKEEINKVVQDIRT